jgi:DNA mismatch repair ATPase MutL
MFNDPLSLEQCERLVRHLAATAFPFQCAHGRLVPLITFPLCLFISALFLDLPSFL